MRGLSAAERIVWLLRRRRRVWIVIGESVRVL
jgi:hypothetical protein